MALLITFSNYLHDLATGVLFGSALTVWVLYRTARDDDEAQRLVLARVKPALSKLAWGSLAWIVVGGIPRTIYFERYELVPALQRGIHTALIIKHVLLFMAVAAGVVIWTRFSRLAAPESSDGLGARAMEQPTEGRN